MQRLQIICFIIFISGMGIWHMMSKDVTFSEHENRVLTSFPLPSIDKIKDGSWMDKIEVYIADQFPRRNDWVGMKGSAEKAIGKHENNGIIFGEDDYLFEAFSMDAERASQHVEAVNAFGRQLKSENVALMLIPSSLSLYPEKAPPYVAGSGEREAIDWLYSQLDERIASISMLELLLKEKDEDLYFRTDHHWTMRGAYEGYAGAAEVFGYEAFARDRFVGELVSGDFYGSYYARANDFSVGPDVISYMRLAHERGVRVVYDDGSERDSLVFEGALDSGDQYRYFLGGNYGHVKVTSDVGNGRKLLLVKDSFAHIMMPYLVEHYEEIQLVDLRYFREHLGCFAADEGFDDVLIMYQAQHFVEDMAVPRMGYE